MGSKGWGIRTEGDKEVLVAEDDEDLRRTMEVWLDDVAGVSVTTVGDGAEAVAALEDADVFVCDRRMPKLSGEEVLETDAAGSTPVVVVSSLEPDDRLSRDDVDHYITKPVFQDELADAIDAVSGRRGTEAT